MFKKPKFIKIDELYNKIIKDFKVDKVYIIDIFHPCYDKNKMLLKLKRKRIHFLNSMQI